MYILTNISQDVDGQVYAGMPTAFETENEAIKNARKNLADDFGIKAEDIENYAQEGGTPYVLSMSQDGRFEAYTVAKCPNITIDTPFVRVNIDSETPMSIEDDVIRVDLVNIGEGLSGDYDPEDPDDINLLRFDVYVKNPDADEDYTDGWIEVEDASYCTQLAADLPEEVLEKAIRVIFKAYRDEISSYEDYLNGPSVKKLGEELSWISETSVSKEQGCSLYNIILPHEDEDGKVLKASMTKVNFTKSQEAAETFAQFLSQTNPSYVDRYNFIHEEYEGIDQIVGFYADDIEGVQGQLGLLLDPEYYDIPENVRMEVERLYDQVKEGVI